MDPIKLIRSKRNSPKNGQDGLFDDKISIAKFIKKFKIFDSRSNIRKSPTNGKGFNLSTRNSLD